jgi:predicted  nucleic acid-binding Zn-ribbon protein
MGHWESVIALLATGSVGGMICWILMVSQLRQLQVRLTSSETTLKTQAEELDRARADVESWRTKHHTEQLDRARFETEAQRVVGLEIKLQDARTRLEAIASERAALQPSADRLPLLEERIAALSDELTELRSANAGLQAQMREQAQAHSEKIAALTEVRGEIEKDLKNIATDALRANQGAFLELANEAFEKHKTGASADLEARQKAVEALVDPAA